jgi:hypothetical protein
MGWGAVALVIGGCGVPPVTAAELPEPATPTVEYTRRQEVLTALPVRVRLPVRFGAERVFVFYRTWGSSDWAPLELARAGQTWTGAVSCRDVSTVTGDTRYFFVVVDGKGHEIGGSGWREWPHVVTVVSNLPNGPQALEGLMSPARCHDPADCPPDFPGCPAYAVRRPACRSDDDCVHGRRCAWDGYCDSADDAASTEERTDAELLAAAVRRATRTRSPLGGEPGGH